MGLIPGILLVLLVLVLIGGYFSTRARKRD